jgi:hypothetical protein
VIALSAINSLGGGVSIHLSQALNTNAEIAMNPVISAVLIVVVFIDVNQNLET